MLKPEEKLFSKNIFRKSSSSRLICKKASCKIVITIIMSDNDITVVSLELKLLKI